MTKEKVDIKYVDDIGFKMFSEAIDANPTNFTAYFGLGNAYLSKEDWSEAIEMYEKVINIIPTFFKAHINMSIAYYNKGNYEKVIELCENVICRMPDYGKAYYWLGLAYGKNGDHKKAGSYLQKATQLANEQAQKELLKMEIC